MMTFGPIPPLRHRAVVERNVEDGVSPTRQPLPARFEQLHAALPCHFWEVEEVPGRSSAGLREGPNTDLVVEGLRMLVGREADIDVGDKVTTVTYPDGTLVTDHAMRCVKNLWRATHRELAFELVRGDTQTAEVAS